MVAPALLRNEAKIPESDVCAVIVTFNAIQENLEASVRCLLSGGVQVVLVENGSDLPAAARVASLGETTQAKVIKLAKNLGIAAAQNIGLKYAFSIGVNFVLLLDHDSLPAENMVRHLLDAYQLLHKTGIKVGAVGPVSIDSRTLSRSGFVRLRGFQIKRSHCEDCYGTIEADFLIASGSLIALDTLREIGGMNEGYFIDHVDTEWCFRAREHKYRIFGVCAAELFHNLGDRVVRMWLGRVREVPVHSPVRNYYIFRNTVLMLRFVSMPLMWRFAHVIRLAQFMIFFSMIVSPRGERLRLMTKGLVDGLLGREGPIRHG
jgi:rhamnosyltransferase